MSWPFLLCLLAGLIYLHFFYVLGKVWNQKTHSAEIKSSQTPGISLIIAFRDEYDNLHRLIQSLEKLLYPSVHLEIIWVDDQSTDGSMTLIETLNVNSKFQHKYLLNKGEGKKDALRTGREAASHDWLLFTDADVWVLPGWIDAMVSTLDEKTRLVCGPVQFESEAGFWNYWMRIEFAGVMASGAALLEVGKPLMANGANLLVHRSLFSDYSVGGAKKSSGDDVFLLQSLSKEADKIKFCYTREAITYTTAPKSLKAFIRQRWRWASKSSHYQPFYARYIPLLLAIYHILIVCWIPWGWMLFIFKILSDAWFFRKILPFFNIQNPGVRLIILEVIHTAYMVFITITAWWVPNTWKGRKVS